MRVITGIAKGKKLISSKDNNIRPTSDKVKMGIFNVLSHGNVNFRFEDSAVLDLFSGSGALGIEALSRGANNCLFVDKSRESLSICEKNVISCNFSEKSSSKLFDLGSNRTFNNGSKFDLIFADPPYKNDFAPIIFYFLTNNQLFKKGSLIVIEESIDQKLTANKRFKQIANKVYGNTQVLFFEVI